MLVFNAEYPYCLKSPLGPCFSYFVTAAFQSNHPYFTVVGRQTRHARGADIVQNIITLVAEGLIRLTAFAYRGRISFSPTYKADIRDIGNILTNIFTWAWNYRCIYEETIARYIQETLGCLNVWGKLWMTTPIFYIYGWNELRYQFRELLNNTTCKACYLSDVMSFRVA